jgi:putative membrane protein
MRSILLPAAALALLTFCLPDKNRGTRDTGMAEGVTDSAAAGTQAAAPDAVLSQLYLANTAEIQLSRLAARKASSPTVKRVATKLVADHVQNREEGLALAQKLNLRLTPAAGGDASTADSAAVPPELQGKIGPDFDRAFVEHEIQEHQDNIEKIQSQLLPAAQNPELKAYLQKTLTAMHQHLASLKQVEPQPG